jgi:hypothetical protein
MDEAAERGGGRDPPAPFLLFWFRTFLVSSFDCSKVGRKSESEQRRERIRGISIFCGSKNCLAFVVFS